MLPTNLKPRLLIFLIILYAGLSGCIPNQSILKVSGIPVVISADNQTHNLTAAPGETVGKVLESAGIKLGQLDKVQPRETTIISAGLRINVVRGREEFETKTIEIPFERQTINSETLPVGQQSYSQSGKNGQEEIVNRTYFEDGQLVSTTVVKTTILKQPVPEILVIGIGSEIAAEPIQIPGKLVYIKDGNAWLIESSTASNTQILMTGDLDGSVLKLSKDGKWLLFTRKSTKPPTEEINTLWAINITDPKAKPINLHTSNVVHFADWDATTDSIMRVLYSTVEPRSSAPGWQANNDLYRMVVAKNGNLGAREKIIETNSGGVYGWWGTEYFWSPGGRYLAYSRPDEIGIVSFKNKNLIPLLSIVPYQTASDWALIPSLAWGGDDEIIYVVTHDPLPGLANPEESPNFNLSAISLENNLNIKLVQQSGMFAYPSTSPINESIAEKSFRLAYLQALSPLQSANSGYQLIVMDRDGSNRSIRFPRAGSSGLNPQTPVWAPAPTNKSQDQFLAMIYQENLWLIDDATGAQYKISEDGHISRLEWK